MVERDPGVRSGDNSSDDDDDSESSPKNRTGRFSLIHRGGTRVEVSDPILLPVGVGTDKPWLCAVKLLGAKKGGDDADEADQGVTQTLLVRTGRGNTPEEAQRDAMAQLSLMYGTPTAAPPSVVITRKPSEPPPAPPPAPAMKRIWGFFTGLFGKGK